MLLCELCHGKFDPETVLKQALSEGDSIFWVCILANDIGAAPKAGIEDTLHLSVDKVRRWKIEDLPVRYGHTSDPIGRVLFGWHLHWDDKPTFACASLSSIRRAPFQMSAPALLTVACQASLGTVNGVPDEISVTMLGARDDTIGLFCTRDSLREVLTRFRFFNAVDAETIKQNCCRASNFNRSLVKAMSTTSSQTLPGTSSATMATPTPPSTAEANDELENTSEVDEVAQQIYELRQKLDDQAEAMNLIRGLMEEWSLKGVSELRASEAPGANKIRSDLERMRAAGVIRTPDDTSQPRVDNADAIREMMEFNMKQFPALIAKSFRDTVQSILEPTTQPSNTEPVDARIDEVLPSVGSSLLAVRATALRAAASVTQPATVRASASRQNPAPKKPVTSLQKIHQALAQNITPGSRRFRPLTSSEGEEGVSKMSPAKLRRIVKETLQETLPDVIQDFTVTKQSTQEEEQKKNALFEAFQQFLENRQQPQPQTSSSNSVQSPEDSKAVHGQEVTSQLSQTGSAVRASGISPPEPPPSINENMSLKDLNIFY